MTYPLSDVVSWFDKGYFSKIDAVAELSQDLQLTCGSDHYFVYNLYKMISMALSEISILCDNLPCYSNSHPDCDNIIGSSTKENMLKVYSHPAILDSFTTAMNRGVQFNFYVSSMNVEEVLNHPLYKIKQSILSSSRSEVLSSDKVMFYILDKDYLSGNSLYSHTGPGLLYKIVVVDGKTCRIATHEQGGVVNYNNVELAKSCSGLISKLPTTGVVV